MMDSKQLALVYVIDECNRMVSIASKNINSLDKKKTVQHLEEQIGRLFTAMKEVAEEFKLSENSVYDHATHEYERRQKEK
jgi:hypothetical protein